SPVITFPDYPAFSEIPDKEFQNVMTYLTSIPSILFMESAASEHWGHVAEALPFLPPGSARTAVTTSRGPLPTPSQNVFSTSFSVTAVEFNSY
ncbi:LOW QUALITY PROTEIN: MCF2L isoform 27, partial [Pan troglodytes]